MADHSGYILSLFADMATSYRPHSVSDKAWPLLQQLGEQRKTRIFSDQGNLTIEADSSTESESIAVFDRVGHDEPGGVFIRQGDKTQTEFVRLPGNQVAAVWFDPHTPNTIQFNEYLRPRDTAGLVFISPLALMDMQKDAFTPEFAAESVMVRKFAGLIDARTGDHMRKDFSRVAHSMGMPRLKAAAAQYKPARP